MIQRGSSRILVALNAIWRSCRVTDWNWSALLLHEFCLLIAATSSSKSIGRRPARHVHNSSELMFFTGWSGHRIGTSLIFYRKVRPGGELHRPNTQASQIAEVHLANRVLQD